MADWKRYFHEKRVWVTGASSGIGRSLVEALGSAGVSTVASARRTDRIADLADRYECVHPLPMDISDFEKIDEMATRAWDLLGGIDLLINNAGVSQRFVFAETDPAVLRRILDVNLTGTMLVTRAVLARMLAAGGGHLVAVTSLAARIPTPLRSVYTAAKMGLHGLFDSLRGELDPRGIHVTLVIPGVVNTEISESAVTAAGHAYGIKDRNQSVGMMPEECAQRILTGVARRRRQITVGMIPRLRLAVLLRRYLPGLYFRIISRAKVSGQ